MRMGGRPQLGLQNILHCAMASLGKKQQTNCIRSVAGVGIQRKPVRTRFWRAELPLQTASLISMQLQQQPAVIDKSRKVTFAFRWFVVNPAC